MQSATTSASFKINWLTFMGVWFSLNIFLCLLFTWFLYFFQYLSSLWNLFVSFGIDVETPSVSVLFQCKCTVRLGTVSLIWSLNVTLVFVDFWLLMLIRLLNNFKYFLWLMWRRLRRSFWTVSLYMELPGVKFDRKSNVAWWFIVAGTLYCILKWHRNVWLVFCQNWGTGLIYEKKREKKTIANTLASMCVTVFKIRFLNNLQDQMLEVNQSILKLL